MAPRQIVAVVVSVGALLVAGPAVADDGCLDHRGTFFNTSSDCTSHPGNERLLAVEAIRWGSHEYLVGNTGNELRLWRIDAPFSPSMMAMSSMCAEFPGGGPYPCAAGDMDYNLRNFSVCDGCRFGVASYATGTALFDLGSGDEPQFVDEVAYAATPVDGAFTFRVGSAQYLIATGLPGQCASGDSTVYRFVSAVATQNPVVGCIPGPTTPTRARGGRVVDSDTGLYLYLGLTGNRVGIYRVDPDGNDIQLVFLDDSLRGLMERNPSFDVDSVAGIAITAYYSSLKVYDIGREVGTPAAPVLVGSVSYSDPSDWVTNAALSWPYVWVGYQTAADTSRTYDLSTPSDPQALDPGFWAPGWSWNDYPCEMPTDAAFSADGDALYVGRYSIGQVVDTTDCVLLPPSPAVEVVPSSPFPGDDLSVVDVSTGDVGRARLWITDGPQPTDPVLAQTAGQPTAPPPAELPWTVPVDLAAAVEPWAHVTVESDLFPGAGGTASALVGVDRAPGVTIAFDPQTPLHGEDVTLTTVAEGHPPVETSAYAWRIVPPAGPSWDETGPVVTLNMSAAGCWQVELAVTYAHQAPGGEPYAADAPVAEICPATVVADFVVDPTAPTTDLPIVLASTSRAGPGAALVFDWDVLDATGAAVLHPLGWCDGPGPVDAVCTIPGGGLDAGVYRFRLRLTNTVPDPDEVAERVSAVLAVAQPIDFSWSPVDPEIGETVLFTIAGTNGSVESAEWTFGDPGCVPFVSPWTCTGPFVSCTLAPFEFSSPGLKTVTLHAVTVDGVVHPVEIEHSVGVQASGSCSSCAIALDPAGTTAPVSGGSGSFAVDTTAGCPWTALPGVSWLRVVSGATGNGPGTVVWEADPNPGQQRAGGIEVPGDSFLVTQAGAELFADGFESGDAGSWSGSVP